MKECKCMVTFVGRLGPCPPSVIRCKSCRKQDDFLNWLGTYLFGDPRTLPEIKTEIKRRLDFTSRDWEDTDKSARTMKG